MYIPVFWVEKLISFAMNKEYVISINFATLNLGNLAWTFVVPLVTEWPRPGHLYFEQCCASNLIGCISRLLSYHDFT